MPWVLDLDGVIWLGRQAIPGGAEAVRLLRSAGEEVVFVTNNAATPVHEQEARLASFGIDADGGVVSSAQASASLLEPGERVLVIGEAGLQEQVRARDVCIVEGDGPVDTVVSGLDRAFGYETLRRAGRAIRGGARWIQTNPDTTFPTPTGLDPGAGALAAAIAAAAGRPPDAIGGKPRGVIIDLLHDRLGPEGVVVGDRVDTDGELASALGYRFGLVLTGVTSTGDLTDSRSGVGSGADADAVAGMVTPWRVADDLLALVRAVVG